MGLLLMIGSLLLGLLVPGWTTLVLAGFFLGAAQAVLRQQLVHMSFRWQIVQSESVSWRSFWIRCAVIPASDSADCHRTDMAVCVFISGGCADIFPYALACFMNKLPHGQMDAPSTEGTRKPSLLVDRNNRMIVVIMICFAFFYAGIETNFANFLPSIMLEKGRKLGPLCGLYFLDSDRHWQNRNCEKSRSAASAAFLKLSASLMILLLVIFALTTHITAQLILIFFHRPCAAGMFPIALTASALMIENAIDEATSYFIAAASLGGACLSF